MTNGTAPETNGITSEAALLPCPYCGGDCATVISEWQEYLDKWGDEFDESGLGCSDYRAVVCDVTKGGCGAIGGWREWEKEAIEAWNTRAAVTDHDCGKCKERQGYYLDAETIQRQQERIAELQVKVAYWVGQYDNAIDERDVRDVLIRDMMPFMCEDDGIERIETRIRELGIEVDE